MIRLAYIIKEHEQAFRDKYGKRLLPSHLKAIEAIKLCRSEQSPKMVIQCNNSTCGHKIVLPHGWDFWLRH